MKYIILAFLAVMALIILRPTFDVPGSNDVIYDAEQMETIRGGE